MFTMFYRLKVIIFQIFHLVFLLSHSHKKLRFHFQSINRNKQILQLTLIQIFNCKYLNMNNKEEAISFCEVKQVLISKMQGQNKPLLSDEKKKSCQYSSYQKRMKNIPCKSSQKLKQKLRQNKVRQNNIFNSQFEKVITVQKGNAYVFIISVGHFETEISFLKINMSSDHIQRKACISGAYGLIFAQELENDIYAIKSQKLPVQSIRNLDKNFDLILEEYFTAKIASILEFGPKIKQIYGFDIVCFNDSVQFSMEFCHPSFQKNIESDLLAGMKIMHSIQLVHQDIKSKNISWSQTFQKWVFLDFGFASFVSEQPGEKTWTSFRGTYGYTSQQMQSLYHLKSFGFVELFQNDLYGLDRTLKNPLECQIYNFSLQNTSQFQFLLHLCRMQAVIFYQKYQNIVDIIQNHTEFKNYFLGLILRYLNRRMLLKQKQHQKLFKLYEKSKNNQLRKKETEIQQDKNIKNTGKQDEAIFEKQRKNIYKLFIQEQKNNKFILIFSSYQDLKKIIISHWDSLSFMKELFLFLEQTVYSDQVAAWKRMKLITQILVQTFLPNCEKKTWIMKFNFLLQLFQERFVESKQYKHLREILFLYYFLENKKGWSRLNKILLKNQLLKDQLLYMYCALFENILLFSSVDKVQQLYDQVKKKRIEHSRNEQIFNTLEKITDIIMQFMLSEQINSEKLNDFQILLEELRISNFEQKVFTDLMIDTIDKWKNKFFIVHSLEEQNIANKMPNSFSSLKYFMFHENLMRLNYLIENSSNILNPYFRVYPLCLEISNFASFSYYLKKGNLQKTHQIAENLFQLNKQCLEEVIDELRYFLIRLESEDQMIKYISQLIECFLISYKVKLNQAEKIEKYWNFYFLCLEFKDFFKGNDKLKKKVMISLQFIVSYCQHENLPTRYQIYKNLFIALKKFHEGNLIHMKQIINIFEKDSLMTELKRNKKLFIEFTKALSFFENQSQIYSFHKTDFYLQICNQKMTNWIFYESPLLLYNLIMSDTFQKKNTEVINTITSHTKYLTNIGKRNKMLYIIFKQFININRQNSFQMVITMIYILQKLSILQLQKNDYLSGFILMIYLKFQEYLKNKLKKVEMQRLYKITAISIDKFPYDEKKLLRKNLQYKFRELNGKVKPRKKKILDRQEDYARSRFFALKVIFQEKIVNKKIFYGNFQRSFENKIKKMRKNFQQSKK